MEQTALEISKEIAHKRIDEICQFEMDLIDVKGQELLDWSETVFNNQVKYGHLWNVAMQLDNIWIDTSKVDIEYISINQTEENEKTIS